MHQNGHSCLLWAAELSFILSCVMGAASLHNSTKLGYVPQLIQKFRPPQQTYIQNDVTNKNRARAQTEANQAYNAVKGMMQNMINWGQLKDIPLIKSASADDLMKYMAWEFKRLPMLHNAPLRVNEDSYGDDTDFSTTYVNGYIQNVCQRYLLGAETYFFFNRESDLMEKYQHYPPFKSYWHPSLREANDRILYCANNWLKTHAGNFLFGQMTYVLNPVYQDKIAIAPCDNADCLNGASFGTFEDFWHLIQYFLTYTSQGTDLSTVFHRWYGNYKVEPSPWGAYPYFELEWGGNVWLPEALLYGIVVFDGLWGTDFGVYVQESMGNMNRPLIWSNGDDSGMLIDPVVNWVSPMQGGYITQGMIDTWLNQWKNTHLSFQQLYDSSSNAIRFQFPGYFTSREACDWKEKNGENILGTNMQGDCVSWQWESNANYKWECLNDGTCERSRRGTSDSQNSCLKSCSAGPWYCQRNPSVDGGAGEYATACVQDSNAKSGGGPYSSVSDCEWWC